MTGTGTCGRRVCGRHFFRVIGLAANVWIRLSSCPPELHRPSGCDRLVQQNVSGHVAATVAGFDGIATEKIHLLFNRTNKPPTSALDSPIWHFGWGSPDMAADFAMHQANGVKFATPLSKLPQGTVFAYMNAPDGALVEINSAQSRAFVHVHLSSEHPLCTADWYVIHLGATRRQPRVRVHARRRTAPRASRWPSSAPQRRPCVLTTSA